MKTGCLQARVGVAIAARKFVCWLPVENTISKHGPVELAPQTGHVAQALHNRGVIPCSWSTSAESLLPASAATRFRGSFDHRGSKDLLPVKNT